MSRICSSRRLISRPFFSFASVRTEKWAELTRTHLGSELRVDATEEAGTEHNSTARNRHRTRRRIRGIFDQTEKDVRCEDATTLPLTTFTPTRFVAALRPRASWLPTRHSPPQLHLRRL